MKDFHRRAERRQLALPTRSLNGRSRLGRGFQLAIVRTHSRACALSVIPGHQPTQLNGSREFAALSEDGADSCGLSLADDEHRQSMDRRIAARKCRPPWPRHDNPSSPIWMRSVVWLSDATRMTIIGKLLPSHTMWSG